MEKSNFPRPRISLDGKIDLDTWLFICVDRVTLIYYVLVKYGWSYFGSIQTLPIEQHLVYCMVAYFTSMTRRLLSQDRELRQAGALRHSADTAAEVRSHSAATAERRYAAHGRRERIEEYSGEYREVVMVSNNPRERGPGGGRRGPNPSGAELCVYVCVCIFLNRSSLRWRGTVCQMNDTKRSKQRHI